MEIRAASPGGLLDLKVISNDFFEGYGTLEASCVYDYRDICASSAVQQNGTRFEMTKSSDFFQHCFFPIDHVLHGLFFTQSDNRESQLKRRVLNLSLFARSGRTTE